MFILKNCLLDCKTLSLHAAVMANRSIATSMLGCQIGGFVRFVRHSSRFSSNEALSAV